MTGSVIPAAGICASALSAERTRLEIVAQNIANMNTTKGPDGQVYRRKLVTFESEMQKAGLDANSASQGMGVKVSKITEDKDALIQVYMPGHPHADSDGMVTMPNINMVEEMADMLTATRSYEANLAVLQAGRKMFNQSLDIGSLR